MNSENIYNDTALQIINVGDDDGVSPVGVMLHGFGSNPDDMRGLALQFLEEVPYWIIPQAPISLLEILSYSGYAWFPSDKKDIMHAVVGDFWTDIERMDGEEIELVAKKIKTEIIETIKAQNAEREIILLGFSQGGMLVSEIILQCLEHNIGIAKGILLSTCLIAQKRWEGMATKQISQKATSVTLPSLWLSHGKNDTVLPFSMGKNLHDFWQKLIPHEFFEFAGGHEVPLESISELKIFLAK